VHPRPRPLYGAFGSRHSEAMGSRNITLNRSLLALALLAAVVLLLEGADRLAARYYLAEAHSRAETALRLTVNVLDGHLKRYETLPELLADNADIVRLVTDPADSAHRTAMNRWLKETNAVLQSSDIYVIDLNGDTIAASNFDGPGSFIGQNFSFRPYFTDAANGGKGRFFALGTTSGVRGYYFAAPIRDRGRIAGVIAIKLGLDHIEATWRADEHQIIVSDPEGIIFLSSDPRWLYAGLLPLTPERLSLLETSRRYADADLRPLPHDSATEQGYRLMSLTAADALRHEYIETSQVMADAGWTVHVLLETAYLRAQGRIVVAAALLLICVAGFATVVVLQRRKGLAERLALQADAQAELERRVEARTADLARVNSQIEIEIAERRLTEQELRRTQADLIQAGKLAALGQMSAALSHEINQPLAAARNYADSAAILIDRGDMARARENVSQILALVDRMAMIGKHLRNVARKPNQALQDIDLRHAMNEALDVLAPRLSAADVTVTMDLPEDLPPVRGVAVRLQQVIVNVLSNAADAMEGRDNRSVKVSASVEDGRVALRIRDHGPGVPAAIADRIFDPFFTTKQVGSGLGLGLSISYNIMKDFGGDLSVGNDAAGGAVFTLLLMESRSIGVAAE
jgi:two-component system, NtrC family, C4-dicarboxylate transport sensor histidine kinase DctB